MGLEEVKFYRFRCDRCRNLTDVIVDINKPCHPDGWQWVKLYEHQCGKILVCKVCVVHLNT